MKGMDKEKGVTVMKQMKQVGVFLLWLVVMAIGLVATLLYTVVTSFAGFLRKKKRNKKSQLISR